MKNGDGKQVGEDGSMLSGGQRSRVSLARALYQVMGERAMVMMGMFVVVEVVEGLMAMIVMMMMV